ncbi:MAG TPA: hypothetical protein VGO19_08635 [Actinomycetes bacterium]
MIDETLLADPTRCPSCLALLTDSRDVCPACGLRLTGPTAARLWTVSVQVHEGLMERGRLLGVLRAGAAMPAASVTAASVTEAAGPPRPVVPPAPKPEWSKRRVQNLLLALGVGLLGVAAVIFLAVSWDHLGVGGRAAVMTGVTAVAAVAAGATFRRGLTSTAEWLSGLVIGLGLLDAYGARAADLAGLAGVDGTVYWAGALAVLAVLLGALAIVLPTRPLPLAAVVAAQLPGLLICAHLVDVQPSHVAALCAVVLTAQAVAALAVAGAWPSGTRTSDARLVLGLGGGLVQVVAVLTALDAAYDETGSLVLGTALLVLLAALPAVGATLLPQRGLAAGPLVPLLDGYAAAVLVGAVWAPLVAADLHGWTPVALGGAGAVLLAATMLVPADRRAAPAVVATVAGVGPALAAADALVRAVQVMLRPLDEPWSRTVATAARAVVDGPVPVVLLVAAVSIVLAAWVLRTRIVAAVPLGALAAVTAAPALGAAYLGELVVLLAVGAVLLVAGPIRLGRVASATGGVLLAFGVTWSFAVDTVSLVVVPVAVLVLVAAALAALRVPALRPWWVALVTVASAGVATEVGALARYGGAGWPAVWSLALLAVVALSVAAAFAVAARTGSRHAFWSPLHTAAVSVATVATVLDAGTVAAWRSVSASGCGLAASVAAGALLGLTAVPLRTARPVRGTVQVVAGAAALPALALAAGDRNLLWLALLAVGVGVALVATTPERRQAGWVSGLLLAASSWVRLALADVTAPEAYTVPSGVALLVVGFVRRRKEPAYGSWRAYGSGLALVLVPSLLRAVTDAGDLRPLLLALAALLVLALGVRYRLQAPLALGALVLGIDAVVQLAPYLVALYEAVPRWVAIGLIGLALLGAGATYEQRVRDLRRVRRGVAGLG